MAGDTWVANDGRIAGAYFGTCWISDTGPYTGPNPAVMLANSSWVPADANTVELLMCAPNPDTVDTHVLNGGYTATDYDQSYFAVGGTAENGDPAALDATPHLFLVWFQPGLARTADPALLVTPSASPLDLAPIGWVSGGRLTAATVVSAAFTLGGLTARVGDAGTAHAALGGLTFTATVTTGPTTATARFVLGASVLDLGNPYNGDWTGTSPPTAGTPSGGLVFSSTAGRPALALYDTDCRTKLANLGNGRDLAWLDEISAPGSLTFAVPLTDTVRNLMQPGCWVKVFWQGRARLAARLTGSGTDLAVDGNVWRKWENMPGALDVLNDGLVLPEYGLRRTSGTSRIFGPMSHYGYWWLTVPWQQAVGFFYTDDTGFRKGKPAGLKAANPEWISRLGPYVDEPWNTTLWFRKTFYTSTPMTYQILAAGDTHMTVYMDGEEIFTPDQQDNHSWRQLATIPGLFEAEAGRHVAAVKVVGSRADHSGSPIALALAFQQTDNKGDPVKGPALIRTDDHWNVSNINPGWNAAEIIAGLAYEARLQDVTVFTHLTRGYGMETDSDGAAWGDPGIHVFDIGTPIGDVLAKFTESHFDAWIDPEVFKLNLYNRKGKDRTATVQFEVGSAGGPAASLKQHSADRIFPRYNSGLIQLRDGTWKIVEDAASIGSVGRAMIGMSLGSTPDADTATEVANTQFKETAHSHWAFTSEISLNTGPQPYKDFETGDTVMVPNESNSGYYAMRVMSISPDFSSDNPTCHVEWIRDV